ncbi:methyl-accepting chemotaxis (MCP) signaling domain protein [Delftia acidovorans]|uniref:methyl-accepting chemotaxis protein n=1 Tax=Delftia TaxID=80865 RepID=UPI000500B973|nr:MULTISPECIES: methyl-accepting chemotaxis protein [Delftia]ATH13767.1 chemotaxis protein [Delftia acidovorans]KFJ10702.1 methyl-accepting chemotaxis (MCP) signaling domain protein [Delftia acidovorans]MBJ2142992.1 type IV pili methyl-accepting chemotaxis transducer N-terminal domain-containing protein [Delftia acidovorans]MCB4787985.1 methyl-accepting chemotaxis protein [Delftia sp. Lp-1]MCG8989797.1 methyl-accepting chemotaxis protein [Delftia acidovorans]
MSFLQRLANRFQRKPADSGSGADNSMLGDTVSQDMYALDASMTVQGAPDAMPGDAGAVLDQETVVLPLLGRAPAARHQRTLSTLLGVSVLALVLAAAWALRQADGSAQQLAATGQALMQSQRLAKSVSQALTGAAPSFADVQDSAGVLARNVRAITAGDDSMGVRPLGGAYADELGQIMPLMERAEQSAKVVMEQKQILTQVGDALRTINRQSSDLLEIAETISSLKLQQGASPAEISAAGQLVMLTQRIGKSANEFQTAEGVSPEAVFLLGKDLNSFKEISESLLGGSSELRLPPTRDAQTREQIEALIKLYEETRTEASAILGNLQGLVSAREAQTAINADSEPLRRQLEDLQTKLQSGAGIGSLPMGLLALATVLVLLCGVGLSRVQLLDSRLRQEAAERRQEESRVQEHEAKRINDANQAAILRLMNELQSVAEGDLTQEATVTEDITGAIADSVNYTVEELRALVGSVQNTATRVAQTTAEVDANSTELLAASTEQLREIRETGRSVLDMAGRINEVSTQAQESAQVARQSLEAADLGLKAVQNAIGGMNSIRDQIQETSKRIKRLGESSQEIGEITELISDITEQTNVLALNAAIQAASAGEAGRGFSVVAEEVQRLAERSADATRQIAALVKAIQTDTQDAVAAMERSTQGVVEGARLSDSAGTALTEIDSVSRHLAELIELISSSTSREAVLANDVAENIQHIFAVTEQTGEGTRTTAQQVRELSHMAEELRQSVARFKIA